MNHPIPSLMVKSATPKKGWGNESHIAFSDFAHIPSPAMTSFVLSLGNDASTPETLRLSRLLKSAALNRRRKIAAASTSAATANSKQFNNDGNGDNGGEEGSSSADEGPCKRSDCTKIRETSDDVEERLYEARLALEEILREKSGALENVKRSVEDAEGVKREVEEKFGYVNKEFKVCLGEVKELEEDASMIEDIQKDIVNSIMILQVDAQKSRGFAREAQVGLVDALWRKKDSSKSSLLSGNDSKYNRELEPLVIRRTKGSNSKGGKGRTATVTPWKRYTSLACDNSIDITEFPEPNFNSNNVRSPVGGKVFGLRRPSTSGSWSGSVSGSGKGYSNTVGSLHGESLILNSLKERTMKTASKMNTSNGGINNRKMMLTMSKAEIRNKGKADGNGGRAGLAASGMGEGIADASDIVEEIVDVGSGGPEV